MVRSNVCQVVKWPLKFAYHAPTKFLNDFLTKQMSPHLFIQHLTHATAWMYQFPCPLSCMGTLRKHPRQVPHTQVCVTVWKH